jgi:hypothetical protein
MKKKAYKIMLSSIAGTAMVAGASVGLAIGLEHHKISDKQFKQEENTDIYELSEINKDLTSIAKMFSDQIVHPGK